MIADVHFYYRLMSRRFPAMAALFLLAAGIGSVMALRQPPYYRTDATLVVEAAQVSNQGDAQVDTEQQLDLLQRRLMTRSNLINIARDNNVFPNQGAMNPDDVVAEMRARTSIGSTAGRNRATVMSISFRGETPRMVANVVNQFVTIALNENSDLRTQRTAGQLNFFEQEAQTLSANLDTQSARIVAFKAQNSQALPENLNYRLSRQTLLQERLSRAERELESLLDQRASIERVYESTGTIRTASQERLTPEQQRLQSLESELNAALAVYSEQNPKVRLLRSRIAPLKEQIEAMAGVPGLEGGAQELSPLDVSLAELDSRAEGLRREISEATAELEQLEQSIDRTPAVRIELEAMERDLANTQSLYSGAVQRLAQARMAERIELSARGEKITLMEPPSVPNSPAGPNRAKIALLGIGVGTALAGGLFVLLEFINTSIRRPADIQSRFNITPLSTLPRFETAAERRRRRLAQLGMLVVVLITVPAGLWAIDVHYMPLDQLFEQVMDRLT